MSIIRVGVLRGGPSREYEVSLKTGQHILDLLKKEPLSKGYKGIDIFIDKKGVWHIDGAPQTPEMALRKADVIFNATKGDFGEDGKLQRILESFSMPYVGSGSYGSAIALNKSLAKEHFKKHGIKTPYYKEFNLEQGQDLSPLALDLFRTFPMPVVVKPRGLGSSLGVSFASNVDELIESLSKAREFSSEVIVEEYLTGKEIISGFIDDFRGKDVYQIFPVEVKPHISTVKMSPLPDDASAPVEDGVESPFVTDIAAMPGAENAVTNSAAPKKPRHSIFDWSSKLSGLYDYFSPARLTHNEKKSIEDAVFTSRNALGLRHFATADFLIHPKRGVFLLEINTQPGLHEHAPLYKALEAAGVKKHEFLEHLLKLALNGEK